LEAREPTLDNLVLLVSFATAFDEVKGAKDMGRQRKI
jgi:hypothetical protein